MLWKMTILKKIKKGSDKLETWRVPNELNTKLSWKQIFQMAKDKRETQLTHNNNTEIDPLADQPQKCHHVEQRIQFYSTWPTNKEEETLDAR